jgi:hypothetical protein
MSSEDIEYYAERAIVERRRAQDAPTPEIAHVHGKLAGLYEALIVRFGAANGFQDLEPHPHTTQPTGPGTLQ